MKKVGKLSLALIVITVLVFFSGCGIYDQIDLEKVKQEIGDLKTTNLDLLKIKEVLEQETEYFGTLEEIGIDDLEQFNIDKQYIAKENGKHLFIFMQEKTEEINTLPLTSFIIVKAAEDQKDLLSTQIETYYQNLLEEYSQKEDAKEEIKEHLKNIMKKEYEGYLIYILSNDNEAVWNKIEESSHPLLFEYTKELSLEEIVTKFSVEADDIKEYQVMFPNQDISTSLYIIIRPKKSKLEAVKKELDKYMKKIEKEWSTYLPEEYNLVKNRMETEIGSYLVYIVSKDNNKVLNTIKNAVVKKEES